MRNFVRSLRAKSETYHMQVHIIIGLICGLFMGHLFPEAPLIKLISVSIIGSVLPDFDHLLFIFIYGRKTDFARIIKGFLRKYKIKSAISFIRVNHKYNTSVYSHNMLSVILAFWLFYYLYTVQDKASMSTFFLSWFAHYVFDIFEDVLFFKKINPNWWLKFSKNVKRDLSAFLESIEK